jgi:hypothetical protein
LLLPTSPTEAIRSILYPHPQSVLDQRFVKL